VTVAELIKKLESYPLDATVRGVSKLNLGKCANPECSTPYFIAQRSSRKYCSGKCRSLHWQHSTAAERAEMERQFTEEQEKLARKYGVIK
jgi:ribosomal protein S27AE